MLVNGSFGNSTTPENNNDNNNNNNDSNDNNNDNNKVTQRSPPKKILEQQNLVSTCLKHKKLKQQNSWNPTRRCSSLTNNPLGIPPLLGIWRCAELGAYTILVGLIEHPNAQATNLPGGRWDEVGLSDGWITSMRYVWGWMDFWGPIGGTSPIQLLKLGNQPTPLDWGLQLGRPKTSWCLDGSLLIFWNSSYPVFGMIYFKKKLWYSFYDWLWFMGSSDIHDINSWVVAFFLCFIHLMAVSSFDTVM